MDTDRPYESPMFPLGTPVMPGMILPLRIFEQRYRHLARHVTSGSGSFATVMIGRGSEVGGRDERTDIGCALQVTEYHEFDDGTWNMVTIACQRIRVLHWIADDPYPRAMIKNWPDDPDGVKDLANACWRLASTLAVGEFDRQSLLAAPSMRRRLDLLGEMAAEQRDLIDLMSQHGGESSR